MKGFKQWVGTDDGMLWNGSEEDGNVRSECEEDEGTNCVVETVTLIGKQSDMPCVLSVCS